MDTSAPVTLGDDRMTLACPTEDLVPEITAACQDRALHRWLEALPDPYTEQDAREFVAHCANGWRTMDELVFAIRAVPGGRLLGMIGLHDLSHLTASGGGTSARTGRASWAAKTAQIATRAGNPVVIPLL